MTYSVTSPQPSGLQPGETVVTLDTGDNVAVAANSSLQANSGCPVIAVTARAIDATGATRKAPCGALIQSAFQHTSCQAEIDSSGGMATVQKCCLLAVLGEPTAPLWTDPLHATMLSNASIRTALATAAAGGPVSVGTLL